MEEKDTKKKSKAVADFLHKAADIGKDVGQKVADGVQDGAKNLARAAKDNSHAWRMKKYNPLFPEKYKSNDFNRPNMIVIVDDAVRRDVDVCEGAIGWLSTENGVEVMYLYDEFVPACGIQFVPTAVCDEVYYVDRFNHDRFIRVDCIFGKAHEEKMAELEYIACCLGAKSCNVEIVESSSELKIEHKKYDGGRGLTIAGKTASMTENGEQNLQYVGTHVQRGRNTTYFEGNNKPTRPQLKWFAHDDVIKRLIEMRCSGENSIKSRVLELEGSSSATMSQNTACAIDGALGKIMNNKTSVKMEQQAKKEHHNKLIFNIEF